MNPMKLNLLVPLIFIALIFILGYLRNRKIIETFITNTWFKKKSKIYRIRKFFYIVGISLLLLSVLDFRGAEEKVESDIPDQKTIIIIDSSASMLAEDVRPNRFKKALIMARHFVKKAFGHKVAVVLFSDQQKRLVPFTDDLDLLDARLSGLESIDIYNGGSNISQAIKESLGYFKTTTGMDTKPSGNILVFTDSEGHDEDFALSLPKTITLGIVAVGTLKGARIPNRKRNGIYRGYKKYNGKEVISKLDEAWLKGLSSKVSNYKYWVANSYTIPTEEIISFFNSKFQKKMSKGLTTQRPVKVEYILIPGMILLILSFMLYPANSFKLIFFTVSLLFYLGANIRVFAQASQPQDKRLAKEMSKEELAKLEREVLQLNELIDKHKRGLLSRDEKMKMAELLMDQKSYDMANTIYEESARELSDQDQNNYAINLIKNKQAAKAIQFLSDLQLKLQDKLGVDKELQKSVRQNMLLALAENKKQQQQKKQGKSKKNKKDSNKDKNQKNKQNQKDGEGRPKENKKKNKQSKSNNKDSSEKKKNENDKNKKRDKNGKQKNQPKSLKEKQKNIERKRKMVKIPGLIKQLMSDDRSLQKKYIDTSTDKQKSFNKKDW